MPLHIPAMAAMAVGYFSAQDCDDAGAAADSDDEHQVDTKINDDNKDKLPTTLSSDSKTFGFRGEQDYSQTSPASSRRRSSVRFSEGAGIPSSMLSPTSVRFMHSETYNKGQDRHMEVRIRSIETLQTSDMEDDLSPFDSFNSFVGGNFASGKVKDIRLSTGCWVMAFSERSNVLAVGLKGQLDFLETNTYNCMHSIPREDKVSAIQWCRGSALFQASTVKQLTQQPTRQQQLTGSGRGASNSSLLSQKELHNGDHKSQHHNYKDGEICAVAGLDGQVSVYHLNVALLEIEGVKTLHEFRVQGQVRSMALESFAKGLIVLAVGDKRGMVTLSSLASESTDVENRDEVVVEPHRASLDLNRDPILGLAMTAKRAILAATTKGGRVVVHNLVVSKGSVLAARVNSATKTHPQQHVELGEEIWSTQRNGPVRSAVVSRDGHQLAFGGYDKTVVLVDTKLWAITREISLFGTVNAIALDHLDRFMAVGCRDKSLTFYDTSTFYPIKRMQTTGWVTSISWGISGLHSDLVAVRSENKGISLLDLTPLHKTEVSLSSLDGMVSAVAWSPEGYFLARLDGDQIHVTDSRFGFCHVASVKLGGCSLRHIAFCPTARIGENIDDKNTMLEPNDDHSRVSYASENYTPAQLSLSQDGANFGTQLAAVGLDGYLHLLKLHPKESRLELLQSIFVDSSLWVVKWSQDGKVLATGGKGKQVHVFSTASMEKLHTLESEGRIWDIDFIKVPPVDLGNAASQSHAMAVASGDYKTVLYDGESMQPTLQVLRSRTVRCLSFHPVLPILAMGDGGSMVAIVDYVDEDTTIEFEVGGRVNVLDFSPAGDFLLIGTDDCCFTLHETKTYRAVQQLDRSSFALSAAFSPSGKYLVVGSANENYGIVRLGPLLSIDLVPLRVKSSASQLPSWALHETLYRSGYGPSLLQRHMMNGSAESLQWVAAVLKEHPDAVYCYDRFHKEGCFDTAVRLRKIKLLQLAVTTLVDGTLEGKEEQRSILTTDIPDIGRATLENMLENHPPEFIVEILKCMRFVKVPFTKPHVISNDKIMTCASQSYLDPWVHMNVVDVPSKAEGIGRLTKTPAVLPLPGLGQMKFLSSLVSNAPATVFDNEPMALVLRVLWRDHIRKYFIVDTAIFILYYILWIVLADSTSASNARSQVSIGDRIMAVLVLILNTAFCAKELVQADLGRRKGYFRSGWNCVDDISIVLVYWYSVAIVFRSENGDGLVPLAVVTSLLLTLKLLSYLRAFSDTGWLVTVLSRNVLDVRGFLVVLLAILVGFSISFRLLFQNHDPDCLLELEEGTEALSQDCDPNPFGSLRRSFLATFELTILGSYDPALLYESQNSVLAVCTFILAITSVLVIALNALISLLADSYARVQENASANRRKEKAQLIVEYMSLIPPWRRRRIESETKYFHALLEADEEGDLVLDHEDWKGTLNALREDMEEITVAQRKALEELKADWNSELFAFKLEILDALHDLSDEVKRIKGESGGFKISGKGVVRAVKAVKQIGRKGSEMFVDAK